MLAHRNIPPDENNRARSAVPDIGPVSSPLQEFPNWRDRSPSNPYRERLLALINAKDEHLVFGATSVLLAILQVVYLFFFFFFSATFLNLCFPEQQYGSGIT